MNPENRESPKEMVNQENWSPKALVDPKKIIPERVGARKNNPHSEGVVEP